MGAQRIGKRWSINGKRRLARHPSRLPVNTLRNSVLGNQCTTVMKGFTLPLYNTRYVGLSDSSKVFIIVLLAITVNEFSDRQNISLFEAHQNEYETSMTPLG